MDISAIASSLSAQSSRPLPKDLEGACRALEQEFGTLVFRKMREAMVPQSSKGSSGFAQDTAQGLLDSQWAQLASQGEGLGLWRTLCRELTPATVKSPVGRAEEKGMIALRPRDVSASAAAGQGAPTAGLPLRKTDRLAPVPSGTAAGHVAEKDAETP